MPWSSYSCLLIVPTDAPHCFWGEVNEDANDLFYMFNDQTPVKDCTDFNYQVSDAGGGVFFFLFSI